MTAGEKAAEIQKLNQRLDDISQQLEKLKDVYEPDMSQVLDADQIADMEKLRKQINTELVKIQTDRSSL